MKSLREQLALGKITRTPTDFQTEVDGNVAKSIYRFSGEVRTERGSLPLAGFEAAKLERTGEGWRIVRISSLRAKPSSESF